MIRPAAVLIALLAAAPAVAQQATRNPHGRLAEECAVCHGPEAWVPARISAAFDHDKKGFVLAGAHATASCRGCHASLDFKGAPEECAACHQDVHRGELGADCARCHTPRSFIDRSGMTRAHQLTRFPLGGAHLAVDCEACHVPAPQGRPTFVSRSTECVDCHIERYRGTTDPDHEAGGFPQDCNQCHSATDWNLARFNHALTSFPLTGAHRAVSCEQCHTTGSYASMNTECVSCHQQAYDATTQPSHVAASFPTNCVACHTTVAWLGAGFDHNATSFPLTGAHRAAACAQCHGDGVYGGKSTACVSCHQTDYDGTTDPAHRAASIPTTCVTCHTTTGWNGATFDHDGSYFPIYSGDHRGKWSSCATCHINANDYNQFYCFSCHEHNKADMDDRHRGKSGYLYDSRACYSCHPRS